MQEDIETQDDMSDTDIIAYAKKKYWKPCLAGPDVRVESYVLRRLIELAEHIVSAPAPVFDNDGVGHIDLDEERWRIGTNTIPGQLK